MDGVLVHGRQAIPGAQEFLERLEKRGCKYLILTNNPIYTASDLAHRLQLSGLNVSPDHIFTSAMATARFLNSQKPNGTAFVIGESGLTTAIHEVGYIITDHQPDYVVVGETSNYSFEGLTKAIRLVSAGSRFIATNPDPAGPSEDGVVPACGALAALIEKASGRAPLFVGKPNPLMVRTAMNYIGVHSENTTMIGDRMDTDIITGVQSGMSTILVLSGMTLMEDVSHYPYQPTRIVSSVAEIEL
jgi:NagD protein